MFCFDLYVLLPTLCTVGKVQLGVLLCNNAEQYCWRGGGVLHLPSENVQPHWNVNSPLWFGISYPSGKIKNVVHCAHHLNPTGLKFVHLSCENANQPLK